MLSELKNNPLLSAATLLAAILAAVDTFAKYLPFPPFWFDVLVVALLIYTLTHWGLLVIGRVRQILRRQESRLSEEVLLTGTGDDRQIGIFNALVQAASPTIVLVAILAAFCIWTLIQPTTHIVKNLDWGVCGTFGSHCQASPCFQFLDSRKRLITGRCHAPADDSGYLSLDSPGWAIYRPRYVMQKCGLNSSDPKPLNEDFFTGSCDQRIVFP